MEDVLKQVVPIVIKNALGTEITRILSEQIREAGDYRLNSGRLYRLLAHISTKFIFIPVFMITSACSQQSGEVYGYDGTVIIKFENSKILYPTDWGPVYDDGQKCVGYKISKKNNMETLIDIKKGLIAKYFNKNADGSAVVYDYDGHRKPICRMDKDGFIRNEGSKQVVGRIHDGVFRLYKTESEYDEIHYKNIPEVYLFALNFPVVWECSVSKK